MKIKQYNFLNVAFNIFFQAWYPEEWIWSSSHWKLYQWLSQSARLFDTRSVLIRTVTFLEIGNNYSYGFIISYLRQFNKYYRKWILSTDGWRQRRRCGFNWRRYSLEQVRMWSECFFKPHTVPLSITFRHRATRQQNKEKCLIGIKNRIQQWIKTHLMSTFNSLCNNRTKRTGRRLLVIRSQELWQYILHVK